MTNKYDSDDNDLPNMSVCRVNGARMPEDKPIQAIVAICPRCKKTLPVAIAKNCDADPNSLHVALCETTHDCVITETKQQDTQK